MQEVIEVMQQQDPAITMADQLVRLVILRGIDPILWMCIWGPALVGLAYLHAKWTRGKR